MACGSDDGGRDDGVEDGGGVLGGELGGASGGSGGCTFGKSGGASGGGGRDGGGGATLTVRIETLTVSIWMPSTSEATAAELRREARRAATVEALERSDESGAMVATMSTDAGVTASEIRDALTFASTASDVARAEMAGM